MPIPIEQHNGVITGYTVQATGPDRNFIQEVSADDTSIEIQNLDPFTLYTFKVSANTDAGIGPAAEKQSKTPEGGEAWYIYVF